MVTAVEATKALERAVEQRNSAQRNYREAVAQAVEAGLTNVKIASIAGVSEAAIRMYRSRNNIAGKR